MVVTGQERIGCWTLEGIGEIEMGNGQCVGIVLGATHSREQASDCVRVEIYRISCLMVACLVGFGGGSSAGCLKRMWICVMETDSSNCTHDTDGRTDSRAGTMPSWLVAESGHQFAKLNICCEEIVTDHPMRNTASSTFYIQCRAQ